MLYKICSKGKSMEEKKLQPTTQNMYCHLPLEYETKS